MGCLLSVDIAELVMNAAETTLLKFCPTEYRPLEYVRYIDDTLCFFKKEGDSELFLRYVNNHPASGCFRFTKEDEEDGKLPFLDIMLEREEDHLRTSVYRKPTQCGRYVHPSSNLPSSVVKSVINTMRSRALRYCSDDGLLKQELEYIRQTFRKNGHSLKAISAHLDNRRKFGPRPSRQIPPGQPTVVLPYQGQAYRALRGYLQRNGFAVRFSTGTSLKAMLYYKDYSTPDPRGVIYKLDCNECEMAYVGETGRRLVQRVKEHKRACRPQSQEKSAIAKHCKEFGHTFDENNVQILDSARYRYVRKLKESFYINCSNDLMNDMEESLPIFNDWRCLSHLIA